MKAFPPVIGALFRQCAPIGKPKFDPDEKKPGPACADPGTQTNAETTREPRQKSPTYTASEAGQAPGFPPF